MSETDLTPEDRALTVKCPDCMAPEGVSCGDQPHADRIRAADLAALEHGTCARCGQPMVRGSVAGAPVDAWHPDEDDAAACPPIPDPKDDWEGYATATNLGLTPGHPGAEHFVPAGEHPPGILQIPEVPPCGHVPMQAGCGGCDPSAIDFVILDTGERRPFDPVPDLRARCPECTNGKCLNCAGQALLGDLFIACACTHQETP